MDRPVAAELHIVRETSATYRVRYLRRSEPGGAAIPWCLHGRDTLRVFLQLFERAWKIESILTRVDAGIRYILDLGYVDEERVARVFRHYAHGLLPAGASDAPAAACPLGPALLQESSATWPIERQWQRSERASVCAHRHAASVSPGTRPGSA